MRTRRRGGFIFLSGQDKSSKYHVPLVPKIRDPNAVLKALSSTVEPVSFTVLRLDCVLSVRLILL